VKKFAGQSAQLGERSSEHSTAADLAVDTGVPWKRPLVLAGVVSARIDDKNLHRIIFIYARG